MKLKHKEITRVEWPVGTVVVGARVIIVTPKPGESVVVENAEIFGIPVVPDWQATTDLLKGKPARFQVLPDLALRLQYIVEAARLRRIPERSKWAKRSYAFASVDAMLIHLLEIGCGRLACELVKYRGSESPDPMDAIEMRVNHETGAAPALEMNVYGFWVRLFSTVNLRLPRTVRKNVPSWACETGPVKFSELLPSHQAKAMDAIKSYM